MERDCHTRYNITLFYVADIFKGVCTFASCFKMGNQGRLLKYVCESGNMFDRRQLGGSSVSGAY